MNLIIAFVDTSKMSLYISLGTIALNPIAWNIVARDGEFHRRACFDPYFPVHLVYITYPCASVFFLASVSSSLTDTCTQSTGTKG